MNGRDYISRRNARSPSYQMAMTIVLAVLVGIVLSLVIGPPP